jgi:2-methylisocitrate lyase-like PEP mutase family enzyme
MPDQAEKAARFLALHVPGRPLLIPNPWDAGSARLLASLGFEALATTSSGFAATLGRRDYGVQREEAIEHAATIVAATELPVSADLENLFADEPAGAADTIRLAIGAGLAGGSIEDYTGQEDEPIYDLGFAAERVAAAAEAAHAGPVHFVLTARAENLLHGREDLADTIRRLQAYQEAGADVLYAPGLTSVEDITTLVRAVDRPVNVVMGLQGVRLDLAALSALGVKRISVGSALARAAFGAFLRAAREMREHGSFNFADAAVSYKELSELFDG